MKSIAVIGGGLGGLSAAIRLAGNGFDVTLFEQNARVGGKLGAESLSGQFIDTGPTVLTMPFVLDELFESVGRNRSDYVELEPVEPTCTYRWSDGTTFRAWSDRDRLLKETSRIFPRDVDSMAAYLDNAAELYELTKDLFLFREFRGIRDVFALQRLSMLRYVHRLGIGSSLHRFNARSFQSPHLIQLFDRFATYNGSSPFRTPATFRIVAHVELGMGAWYPKEGMGALAHAVQRLAEDVGVTVKTGAKVTGLRTDGRRVTGVVVKSQRLEFDHVVCNMDVETAAMRLLEPAGIAVQSHTSRDDRSLSGLVFHLSCRSDRPIVDSHHTIFFSDDYRREFDELFGKGRIPDEPTIYVSDPSYAGPQQEEMKRRHLYVLVNAPAKGGAHAADGGAVDTKPEYVLERVLKRLESFGERPDVQGWRALTPAEFARRNNSLDGALYGSATHSFASLLRRPRQRIRGLENFYFVGGTTHPGGGLPLVILSGKIVAEMIAR